MRTIAKRSFFFSRKLTAAKRPFFCLFCVGELKGFEARASMASVAKGLVLRLAARAPVISLALRKHDPVGLFTWYVRVLIDLQL